MEKELLLKRAGELAGRAYQNGYVTHTDFLTEGERMDFLSAATGGKRLNTGVYKGVEWVLHGGWEEAERSVLYFLPDYMDAEDFLRQQDEEPEAVSCLSITPVNRRFAEPLTHRDYLGALMNLGIERDRIGDILTGDEQAYAFVLADNADMICRELIRVRRTSVTCLRVAPRQCGVRPEYEEKEGSVSSERLDAILAMVYHLARGRAQELIEHELVMIDGKPAFSGGYDLKPGSRVSVRGYGKFQYLGVGNQTKKGRFYARVKIWK